MTMGGVPTWMMVGAIGTLTSAAACSGVPSRVPAPTVNAVARLSVSLRLQARTRGDVDIPIPRFPSITRPVGGGVPPGRGRLRNVRPIQAPESPRLRTAPTDLRRADVRPGSAGVGGAQRAVAIVEDDHPGSPE